MFVVGTLLSITRPSETELAEAPRIESFERLPIAGAKTATANSFRLVPVWYARTRDHQAPRRRAINVPSAEMLEELFARS